MNKTDNPLAFRYPVLPVSREGMVSFALVLAVHLLAAAWIGWGESAGMRDITPPMTGMLVAGNGGTGSGNPQESKAAAANNLSGRKTPKAYDKEAVSDTAPGQAATETAPQAKADAARAEGMDVSSTAHDGTGTASDKGTGSGGNGMGGYGGNGPSGGIPGYGNAAALQNPKPPYPAVSRRMGEEGVVMLSVMIEADGTVSDVKVTRSSGFPRLDASALDTVRHWRYVPAKKNGVPVAFRYAQPIRFSLDD